MKLFLTYWILAGALYMYWADKDYRSIQKRFPIIDILPKWAVLLLQFLVGGLIVPFFTPLKIQILYLQIVNYILRRQNSIVEKENSVGQFVVDIVEDEIWEAKAQFHENGKVEFVTVVITNKKEVFVFTIDPDVEKYMDVMMQLIKDKCMEHKAVAVIQISEAYEYKDENKIESERKEVLIASVELKGQRLEYIFGLDRSAKKIIDYKESEKSDPVFKDYLDEIYTSQSNQSNGNQS